MGLLRVLLLAVLALSAYAVDESAVTVIAGKADFDAALASADLVMVEFYAPWCGHCKELTPKYAEAAATLAKGDASIKMAKLDATDEANAELAQEFKIKGFPTLKVFRKADTAAPMDYQGARTADGLVAWLTEAIKPATTSVTSADVKELTATEEYAALLALVPDETGAEFAAYEKLANSLRETLKCMHTTDAAVLTAAGAEGATYALLKSFDEPVTAYSGDADGIEAWVEETTIPLVTELDAHPRSKDSLRKLYKSPLAKLLLFADYSGGAAEELMSQFAVTAKAHKGQLFFVKGLPEPNAGALSYFGLTADSDLPAVVIHDTDKDIKFKVVGVSAGSLETTVASYLDGSLKPFIKSEAVPEDNSGPVKTAVADNWAELMEVDTADSLVMFYAPWCGHCKKLHPIMTQVGEHFASDASVQIVQMDFTANELSDKAYAVKGYPTLYLRQASGALVPYSGDRSMADLIKFVEDNKTVGKKDHDEL